MFDMRPLARSRRADPQAPIKMSVAMFNKVLGNMGSTPSMVFDACCRGVIDTSHSNAGTSLLVSRELKEAGSSETEILDGCSMCKNNTFKLFSGNSNCLPCPANSTTTPLHDWCICDRQAEGFLFDGKDA